MTERTPPTWLQSGSYPAEDDRRFLATIFGDLEGIIKAGDLAVSQRGAGANMSVDVAGGRAIINGDLSTYEGSYFVENRGVTNLAISASDPTNPRIDRVVAEVLNAEYTGASNLWRLRVITGTPAGSPVAPAVPSNAISLATVAVAALASSITNANITSSVPTRTTALGGTIICTSTTRPASAVQGTRIYETDTKLEYTYDGASWIIPYALGRLGYSSLVANSASFIAIIYPLSVSVTPLPNRRLRIECHANVYSTTTGANVSISVANNAGTILNQAYRVVSTASLSEQITAVHLTTSGGGGSTTWKMGAFANVTSLVAAAGTAYTYIAVYDEGPV